MPLKTIFNRTINEDIKDPPIFEEGQIAVIRSWDWRSFRHKKLLVCFKHRRYFTESIDNIIFQKEKKRKILKKKK